MRQNAACGVRHFAAPPAVLPARYFWLCAATDRRKDKPMTLKISLRPPHSVFLPVHSQPRTRRSRFRRCPRLRRPRTMDRCADWQIHHHKHHQAYVDNLNKTVASEPSLAGKPVEELLANLEACPDGAHGDSQSGRRAREPLALLADADPGLEAEETVGSAGKLALTRCRIRIRRSLQGIGRFSASTSGSMPLLKYQNRRLLSDGSCTCH